MNWSVYILKKLEWKNVGKSLLAETWADGTWINKRRSASHFFFSFLWMALKIHYNYQQRWMSEWHSNNQHVTPKIQTHPFPVFLCVRLSSCVGTLGSACISKQPCACVCGFIFMKQGLARHTVGVSRSSSLAINHFRQLLSIQSTCERTACVWTCERACICMCVFDWQCVDGVFLQDPPEAAYWIRDGLCWC